jgi:predicted deacylase
MSVHPAYHVELQAPDISPYREGNTGVDFVHRLESGKPGPEAMINAVIHGNELCGAIALDTLLRAGLWPTCGSLTLCFVNPSAYSNFDPENPTRSRFVDEDMNRVWAEDRLNGEGSSTELRRARELRPFFDRAERLLDIHSMGTYSEPILLIHGHEKERRFAQSMGFPKTVACGKGHVDGLRLIEYAPFNDPDHDHVAVLVECGQHWAAGTDRVAIDTVLYFLDSLGMVDPAFLERHVSAPRIAEQLVLEITDGYAIHTDDFYFLKDYKGLERFAKAGSVFAVDGGEELRTPYDDCVLIMPNHRAVKGQRAFRLGRAISGPLPAAIRV